MTYKPTHGGKRLNADRINIRLGNLATPLQAAADAAGVSITEMGRRCIEQQLGIEHEPNARGNPNVTELAKKRWGKTKAKTNQPGVE